MIAHQLRQSYYTLLNVPMWLNNRRYRLLAGSQPGRRVHLGCGRKNYIPGWLNVDANVLTARPDLWINLLHGLPFPDDSVARFYTFHVLEHLPEAKLPWMLREMFRCLEPGGGVRVGVPHAGNAYRMYVANRPDWFSDFPEKRASIGGRCANFLLCAGEHTCLIDGSYLGELMTAAGFTEVREMLPCRESDLVDGQVLGFEYESDFEVPHTLVIEGRKPNAPATANGTGHGA